MNSAARIPAVIVMAAAAVVLVGWLGDMRVLTQLSPDWVSMKFNTALSFLAAGAALWSASAEKPAPGMRTAGTLLAILVCLSGLAALFQYLSGADLGIDQLFVADDMGRVGTSHPGRMSPLTALAFSLAGTAILGILRSTAVPCRLCRGPLVFGVFALPLWALITYLYRSPEAQLPAGQTVMALHTSVLFIVLSAGIALGDRQSLLRRMVFSRTLSGAMLRRILPLAAAIPVFIGWLRLKGQAAGLYGTEAGAAMTALAAVLLMACVVYLAAKPAYLLELKKYEAELALRENHVVLERLVAERTAALSLANKKLLEREAQREAAEAAQKKLQEQLLQSQKMEAVGRLAGGVAHDFNNLLGAILGYARFLIDALPEGDPRRADTQEIIKAGEKATGLARQLLAFSRKQVLQPRVLDLGAVVADMGKLLRRVIGENIELDIRTGHEPGRVFADPGQMEQVIMNLAVNARDAMPGGGRLTLETSQVELDEAYLRTHAEAVPGRYIMLAVSDTGCGMDQGIRSHLFEPFFTTKEKGKGTGLGLATVYGIVKQSGGNIFVYSEPGKGAAFKIYLPASGEPAAAPEAKPVAEDLRGNGTVLVVEDDEALSSLARRILSENGYTVLTALTPAAAMEICRAHAGVIDVLITDLVLPGMGGRELADKAAALRPGLKVIFVSGYTEAIVQQDAMYAGEPFLEKPFSAQALLGKVKEVLAAASAGAAP